MFPWDGRRVSDFLTLECIQGGFYMHHLLGEMMKTRPEKGWTDDALIIIIILMIMIHQYLLDP